MRVRRVVFWLAAFAAGLALSETAVAASAEKGKQEFFKHGCWQCHGDRGQGGVAGPRLAPDPIAFDTLKNFVRTTDRAMPAFREQILSDEELTDIYAYLQSIPKGADANSIPLLNP